MAAVGNNESSLMNLYLQGTDYSPGSYAKRVGAEDKLISSLILILREVGRQSGSLKDLKNNFVPLNNRDVPLKNRINTLVQNMKNFAWPAGFSMQENSPALQDFLVKAEEVPVPQKDEEKKEPLKEVPEEAPVAAAPAVVEEQFEVVSRPLFGLFYNAYRNYVQPSLQSLAETSAGAWIGETTVANYALKPVANLATDNRLVNYFAEPIGEERETVKKA